MNALEAKLVSFEQWRKVCLTIGRATLVKQNESAKIPSYLINLDFGNALNEEHAKLTKRATYLSSAQLCANHNPEDIEGYQLMCVVNFPRKQIGKIMSDCLTTGAQIKSGSPETKRETTVFIKPSHSVEVGSRINILAHKETLQNNERNLNWEEFTSIELKIGTIEDCEFLNTQEDTLSRIVKLTVNLGDQNEHGVGILNSKFEKSSLLGKQVMVLTNLEREEIRKNFDGVEANVVLCTVNGEAVLEPAKQIPNGYIIA